MGIVMQHYPDPKKLRIDSMTKGLSWADQEMQECMVNSARLKVEETLKNMEEKSMFDVTSYGQAWISDNIRYLSEQILTKPTTEICKAYINFPAKFRMEDGKFLPTDEYLSRISYYRSRGIKYQAEVEGENLDPEQIRINEFVSQVMQSKSRSLTVAFVVLNGILSTVLGKGLDRTQTAISSGIMKNIMHQFIVLKNKELKEIMDVPSVANIQKEDNWTRKRDKKVTLKGKKLLQVFGIQSYRSISENGMLAEGLKLMHLVCEAIPGLSMENGEIHMQRNQLEKLQDIRSSLLNSACEARPVLERPVSNGYMNSYRDFPLKDYLVGGYNGREHVQVSEFDRRAIDRIQGTPFSINRRVLSTIKQALTMGVEIEDKLSVSIPEDFPALSDFPKREDFFNRADYNQGKRDWFDIPKNKERYREWKVKREERSKKQQAAESINDMNVRTLEIAQWYADWGGSFYLPVFMDYRTRMYYLATIFNPQSSKLAKSLFIGCRGKELKTEKALEYWLVSFAGSMKEIHCPKTGKIYAGDKCSWNLAVNAGRQELKTGAAIAADPLSEESIAIWSKQDNPFEYLAHCFECQGILDQGLSYYSSIFINMDGSCNAYQHAAGYLADWLTGMLVNLTYRSPEEDPADLYSEVCQDFENSLNLKENGFHKLFKFHDVVTRKSCKRITMCQGYGLTPSGAKNYGREEIEKFTDSNDLSNPFDIIGREESYSQFSEGVQFSVSNVAPAIMKVKEALQMIAGLTCDPEWNPEGLVSWTTYTGTKVSYTKKKEYTQRVNMVSGNKRVRFTVKKLTDKTDQVSVTNAGAPNYTHSRDADHMRMSISKMPEDTFFLVIHDSFGTHAADAPAFCEAIKESFIEMYKEKEPLKDLFKETVAAPGGCLSWCVRQCGIEEFRDVDWVLTEGNLETLTVDFGKGQKYSGPNYSKLRKVVRTLVKIRKRIKRTENLDFDAIRTCVYPFR